MKEDVSGKGYDQYFVALTAQEFRDLLGQEVHLALQVGLGVVQAGQPEPLRADGNDVVPAVLKLLDLAQSRGAPDLIERLDPVHAGLAALPDRVALFGPLLQLGRNTSWSGRSIEPKFAREYTPPHLIVRKETTETARRVMSMKSLRFTGISPVQMEYFVNQVTGGLYRRTVGGAETAVKVIMGKNVRTLPAGPWDLPIVGGLFARPSILNTKWTERFYAHWKDMNQRRRSDHPHSQENVLKQAYSQIRRIRASKIWSDDFQDRKVLKVMEEAVKHIQSGRPDLPAVGTRQKRASVGF